MRGKKRNTIVIFGGAALFMAPWEKKSSIKAKNSKGRKKDLPTSKGKRGRSISSSSESASNTYRSFPKKERKKETMRSKKKGARTENPSVRKVPRKRR